MNKKGFTLIEMLGCLALLGLVLGIGLFVTRDTLASTFSVLTEVSVNQIYDASELYVIENKTTWIHDKEEYTCLPVKKLVDGGYFDEKDVLSYKDNVVRIVREPKTKVINSIRLMDVCE